MLAAEWIPYKELRKVCGMNFLQLKCWRRFRKHCGLLTGITQNISECLLNTTARDMFSNSEFLLLFNQAPSDRKDLSELLSISDTQMSYITNTGAGRGLIKVGSSIVPFTNEFPTDTELYKLWVPNRVKADNTQCLFQKQRCAKARNICQIIVLIGNIWYNHSSSKLSFI